jgi:hypothetical protein
MIELEAVIVSRDGLVGRCGTCRHDNMPSLSMCDVEGWDNKKLNPGRSCRYHEPKSGCA